MGKRANKRQKTGKASAQAAQPLGAEITNPSLLDDASKDDEERKLESMLFGKAYVPAPLQDNILVVSDDEQEDEPEGAKEFETMLDSDLFFVDDANEAGAGDRPEVDFDMDIAEHDEPEESGEKHSEDGSEDEESDDEEKSEPVASSSKPPQLRKGPAWVDPDDANLEVSLANNKRLRKMRDAPSEDAIGGREYERRLRRQFERINPTPEWAKKARSKLHPTKKRRAAESSDEDEPMDEDLLDTLASTDGILGRRRTALQQGTLSIERLRDANISAPAEGAIKAIQFHPSADVPLLLTASEDRRLRSTDTQIHISKQFISPICR
ncbi:hypothetical protein NM688_g6817 [Phlebia brevispora]|uniref:Uncharacterized protein n=1 Tax=Phlebia brevispora TaxID=194682 RepID=A0ACC1SC43_9APHY|nr:hypothetical protein NM688_g6817 [Phlebia brevispora]